MRLEDMTPKMIEQAKGCETDEERLAFIQENGIELTDEQLEGISGGSKGGTGGDVCKKNPDSDWHVWEKTGRIRPGRWLKLVDEPEYKCKFCGDTYWGLW